MSQNDPSIPGNTTTWLVAPGTKVGVWQKLSTRDGGEVLSADSY